MKIEIINGGLFTSIQDMGRPDGGAFGIPWGGAMDRTSARNANQLVGNPPNSALLEMTLIGAKIKFSNTTDIAICGADLSPKINNLAIPNNQTLIIRKNDVLSFTKPIQGCRAYLAIVGEIDIPLIYGSKSTYTYANLGGHKGRSLQKGDFINILSNKHSLPIPHSIFPCTFDNTVKIVRGPEFKLFSHDEINKLTSTPFIISNDSNRMGYRLKGKKIIERTLPSIISSGTVRGTIQVPNAGNPIILMADSPTTGGYPRIANCINADVDKLAQLKPGDKVSFKF